MTSVWAHRGQRLRPREHVGCFRMALEQGRTESNDVQLSRDGELVVIHDERVDRTTNGTGWVADHPGRVEASGRGRRKRGSPASGSLCWPRCSSGGGLRRNDQRRTQEQRGGLPGLEDAVLALISEWGGRPGLAVVVQPRRCGTSGRVGRHATRPAHPGRDGRAVEVRVGARNAGLPPGRVRCATARSWTSLTRRGWQSTSGRSTIRRI